MFAQDLRERQRKKDKNYRMLVYLFNEEWRRSLSDWDSALVEEVCGAGGRHRGCRPAGVSSERSSGFAKTNRRFCKRFRAVAAT
jgi:hypothetical protein